MVVSGPFKRSVRCRVSVTARGASTLLPQAWGCSTTSPVLCVPAPAHRHPAGWPRQGHKVCVGVRKFPLGLLLSLQIFITLWGPIVSGSGNGGGGTSVEFPETGSLKGKGIFSYTSPQGRRHGVGHPAFQRMGVGQAPGALPPEAEANLGSQHFPGESAQFPVTILVSLSQ